MTDEMLVEAVARAIHTADSAPESHPLSKCPQIEKYRFVARAAIAALPPEMRAAGEMKRALARYMNSVSDLHGHFDWESGYGRTRGPVDEEFDAATEEARAALATPAHYTRAVEEREGLIEALENLVADVLEYERINNLAPNPGRRDCWQSVTNARAILSRAQAPTPKGTEK